MDHRFSAIVGTIQVLYIVIFGVFIRYSGETKISVEQDGVTTKDTEKDLMSNDFPFFQDIHVMIFFGIAFLYTFLQKYGYTGITMSLLLATLSMETSLIINSFLYSHGDTYNLNIHSFIQGEYAAATTLIALGAVFGKISSLQMVFLAIAETVCYVVHDYWNFRFLQPADLGESVALHLFAALFGLSAAYVVDRKKSVTGNPNENTTSTSNVFSLIGTIVLWVYWPTFNVGISDRSSQHRTAINTTLALLSSCITTCVTSSALNKQGKMEITHIQNATLAGGVAIGSTANLMIEPAGALVIGGIGGIISVLGFKYFSSFLDRYLKVYDPCGINALHAIPGAFAGIVGVFTVFLATDGIYGDTLYEVYPAMGPVWNSTMFYELQVKHPGHGIIPGKGRTILMQCGYQILYIVSTVIFSVLTGLLTGLLLRSKFLRPLKESDMYSDERFFVSCEDKEENKS